MSSLDLSSTLLHFLRLFNPSLAASSFSYPPTHPSSLSQLTDGLYLYRLLHTLDPAHFDLDGIDASSPTSPSSTPSHDTLQHLLVSLETYMEDVSGLGRGVDLSGLVDVERMDDGDAVRLVQVAVLCAINSAKREEVVERVMEMGEKEQEQMMQSVNDILARLQLPASAASSTSTPNRLSDASSSGTDTSQGDPRSPTSSKLNSSFNLPSPSAASTPKGAAAAGGGGDARAAASLERELRELRRLNAELVEEGRTLKLEREMERGKGVEEGLQRAAVEWNERWGREQQKQSREQSELQHRLTELQSTLQLQQRAQLSVEKEKVSLAATVDDLRQRLQQLDDDLQVAQAKADQAGQLEAKVARLTGLLNSVGDLKAQAEYSEEEARKSVERIAQLEREVKEAAALKASLQRLKAAVVKKEEEALEWKLKVEELKAEVEEGKEMLKERERQAKDAEDEARRLQAQLRERERSEKEGSSDSTQAGGFEVIGTPRGAMRDKIRRLETELELLRGRRSGDSSVSSAAPSPRSSSSSSSTTFYSESEMEVVRSIAAAHEAKYLEAMRKVAQLERQLRQLHHPVIGPQQQNEEIERLHSQLEEANSHLLQLSLPSPSSSSASDASSARKLRKYAELWRHASQRVSVYRAAEVEWKKAEAAMQEQIGKLKEVIIDREREVEVRERVRVEEMAVSLRERRIMQAAFYNLGTEWAQALVVSRAKGGAADAQRQTGGRAWLAQQRAKTLE